MSNSKLIPISYDNASQGIRLSAYADTIVYEPSGGVKTLRAIRFGGYPEMVNAMSDAIYAGGKIEATVGGCRYVLAGESKRFERQLNHDGVYAEATLLAKDDDMDAEESGDEDEDPEQESFMQKPMGRQAKENKPPHKCIIFCPKDDRDRLFDELDSKTAVPLIPEFWDYVLEELQRRNILQKLAVVSIREKIDAWTLVCEKDDANIISVVEDGLQSGAIAIPCEVKDPDGFRCVTGRTKRGISESAPRSSRTACTLAIPRQQEAGTPAITTPALPIPEVVKHRLMISYQASVIRTASCRSEVRKDGQG